MRASVLAGARALEDGEDSAGDVDKLLAARAHGWQRRALEGERVNAILLPRARPTLMNELRTAPQGSVPGPIGPVPTTHARKRTPWRSRDLCTARVAGQAGTKARPPIAASH